MKKKNEYDLMLRRASIVTWHVPYNKLTTHEEKRYIELGVNRMLANDTERGGYGGRFKEYILKGGRVPKRIK